MWPIILLGLLVACLAGWLFSWLQQRNRIRQLERSNEEIRRQTCLVFCMAGEAFTSDPARLTCPLIVEGRSILLALGRALYDGTLLDESWLPPTFRKVPRLRRIPQESCESAKPAGAGEYLRLQHSPGGQLAESGRRSSRSASVTSDAPELLPARDRRPTSFMVTRSLRKTNMGCGLGNGPMSPPSLRSTSVFSNRSPSNGLRSVQRHHLLGSERKKASRSRP